MTRYIRLTFTDEQLSATARLLDERAPETCGTIWANLPFEGKLGHGMCSGPEVMLHILSSIVIPLENSTTYPLPGELGYVHLQGWVTVHYQEDISEICVFYARGARPGIVEGPVPVNIFAEITEGFEPFAAACRRVRVEGYKPFRITRLEAP
jgi:hypothetical protein